MSRRFSQLSLLAMLVAIHVGGPLLWLAWMVFNSHLLSREEALRVLTAGSTLTTLVIFLAINAVVLGRGLRGLSRMAASPTRFTRPARAARGSRETASDRGPRGAFRGSSRRGAR